MAETISIRGLHHDMLTMNYLLSVTKDCGVVSGDLKSTDQEEVEIHVAAQDRST